MQPWFTVYFIDIGHPCYDQLTPLKTRFPQTSITWPYRGLKFTAHRGQVFFKVAQNYQNRGLCYLPKPKAEADNTARGLDNCLIIHFSHNSSSETEAKRSAILFLQGTWQPGRRWTSSAADIAFIMSSSQAIVNWLNALDRSDFS